MRASQLEAMCPPQHPPHCQAGELLARASGGFTAPAEVKVESQVPGDDALMDSRLFLIEERPRVVEI